MSPTAAPEEKTLFPRYQAWLDAGKPRDIYSIWSNEQWRLYFVECEGREPGSNQRIDYGRIAIDTAEEEMGHFVMRHQDDFTAWLLDRVHNG